MDTTKTYIKMSDHPKIQGEWKLPPFSHDFCYRVRDSLIKPGLNLSAMEFDAETWLWLPSQDQIQEMMPQCNCSACLTEEFYHFHERNIDGFFNKVRLPSMEQIWLAFYMHKKHELVWSDEKWVKS